VKARAFGEKGGRGRDGWAKARLGMGAGKEVSSMPVGGTASTLFDLELWWRTVVLDPSIVWGGCQRCARGEFCRIVVFSVLTEYVTVRVG
jgi:hypothetical protein